MRQILYFTLTPLMLFVVAWALPAAAAPEKRMALVIGNSSYSTGSLATPANDAGLIAQTLQAASFDVFGARDLDENSMRHAFMDFVDHLSNAGPDTVAVVYFAGRGLQLEGENYLLPIDAKITSSDVLVRALRLSDYTHALWALHLKAAIVVVDAACASPLPVTGQPLAGGLAWTESEPGMLIAFNATPGTIAPDRYSGYGPYAKALVEMIREGGLPPADVFDRVRLRVNEVTQGAQVPWDISRLDTQFVFFERRSDAPPPAISSERTTTLRSQLMSDLDDRDAYISALLRDTFDGYADFLAVHTRHPMARQARALLAARREAITWRRIYEADTPEAFWSYLTRYPRGPHVPDARRLLVDLDAAIEAPSKFKMIEYDMPTPQPAELEYIERPVVVLDDPILFAPPHPLPDYFLAPPRPELVALEQPTSPEGAHILPVPIFVPIPNYVTVPTYVIAPPNPVIKNLSLLHSDSRVVVTAPIPSHDGIGVARLPAFEASPPPAVLPMAEAVDNPKPRLSAANPATTGAIALAPGSQSPTIPAPHLPSTTANHAAEPSDTTALVPIGNMPMPRPRPATLAALEVPLPIPRPATLSPGAVVRQASAPLRKLQAPPPSPQAAAQGTTGAAKPPERTCQVINGKQVCK